MYLYITQIVKKIYSVFYDFVKKKLSIYHLKVYFIDFIQNHIFYEIINS